MHTYGVDRSLFTRLNGEQTRAEGTVGTTAYLPTSAASVALFVESARIAQCLHNVPALTAIGGAFGRYIYLFDAYQDLSKDMSSGSFNPLRQYATESDHRTTLTTAGVHWLLGEFITVHDTIQQHLPKLHLRRYYTLLYSLINDPVSAASMN